MKKTITVLALILNMEAGLTLANEGLVTRANGVLNNQDLGLETQTASLAIYADSLRTIDVVLAAKCLERSGIGAFRLNQLDSALARWQRGLKWVQAAGEEKAESSLLNALAIGHTAKGDVEKALPVYDRALEIREAQKDTMGLARTWGNLANAYANMGRTAEALAATAEAGKWLALVDNPRGQIAQGNRRGQMLTAMGRLDEALLQNQETLEFARQNGQPDEVGMSLMKLGNSLLDLNRPAEALSILEEAHGKLLEADDQFAATFAMQSIISALIIMDRPVEALVYLEEVIPEVESAGQIPLLTVMKRMKGHALFNQGKTDEALTEFQEALELFEQRWKNLEDDKSRAGIFAPSGEIYASVARCFLADGNVEAAFQIVEQGRAPGFRHRVGSEAASLEALQVRLAETQTALILFNDPGYDPLVAMVLDGHSLRYVELGDTAPFAADARSALGLLAAGESLDTCRPALKRLEEGISLPIMEILDPQVQRLTLVPPSFLAGFPLGILGDGQGQGWGESRPLSYLPNASALIDLGSRVHPSTGVLALADPTSPGVVPSRLPVSPARARVGVALPESREEIVAVTRFSEERLVGDAATGDQLRQALQSPLAVLHLATHAVVDAVDGGKSAVVLAGKDGVDAVTAEEISTYQFQGDLVVLSGCSTFGEHQVLGEGWFGLPRSFLAAGARTVVSTLWDVDDRGARQFVTAFYGALKTGASRDQAMVQAREYCRQQGMPPREWAAFVLTGVGNEGLPLLYRRDNPPWRLPLIILAGILGAAATAGWLLRRRY